MTLIQIILVLLALLVVIAGIVALRTVMFVRRAVVQPRLFQSPLPAVNVKAGEAAEHLSSLVQIKTISHEDPRDNDNSTFKELHKRLAEYYPSLHKNLGREVLDGYSLLYTWQGSDPALEPVCFMAHQDVVPADESTLDKWTHPPFSGKIADGFVWGRGAQDIKCQLVSVMEAVEHLIKGGYQPERTILLAFGHDEEVLGTGAKAIVAHLKEKGIRLAAVIDEGGSVYDGIVPGIRGQSANIGLAEKGYLSLKFTVNALGGHSSVPKPETAIGILARAIDRLQSNPFPYKVETVLPMFKGLMPAANLMYQVAFSNLWLFGGIIRQKLASDPQTAATIHTTTAPTIFHSGVKDNVLPSLAEAVINFRVLPGESISQVCDRIKEVISDDRVTFEPLRGNAWEASPISPTDCPAYHHLASVITAHFPDAVCAPYNMLGGSDARNYYAISDNVYRFSPLVVTKADLAGIHGVNERISVEALDKMVRFFCHLMPRWASRDM